MGYNAGTDAFKGTGTLSELESNSLSNRNTVRRLGAVIGALGASSVLAAIFSSTAASEPLVVQQGPGCAVSSSAEVFADKLKSAGVVASSPEEQRSIVNIQNMHLSCDGLVRALSSVNTDYYAYAQSKPTFNPAVMASRGIAQAPVIFYTKHVAASYYNSDGGSVTRPSADPSVTGFIDAISGRGNVCCGVNQFIDRNGAIYWLAPGAAMLRHNLGYDGQTTGHEIEGYVLGDVQRASLEASAYLDIGNMVRDNKLTQPLHEVIDGHAVTRTRYNRAYPAKPLDIKIDWTEGPVAAYRLKLAEFITANPDIAYQIPQTFMQLP